MKIFDWRIWMERPGFGPVFAWVPVWEQMELFGTDDAREDLREGGDGETAQVSRFLDR